MVHHSKILNVHVMGALFAAVQPGAHIVKGVFKVREPCLSAFYRHMAWLSWCARLRRTGFGICRFFVNGGVFAGATLNLSEAIDIPASKVSIAVFEFPKRSVWVSGMEDVSFYTS